MHGVGKHDTSAAHSAKPASMACRSANSPSCTPTEVTLVNPNALGFAMASLNKSENVQSDRMEIQRVDCRHQRAVVEARSAPRSMPIDRIPRKCRRLADVRQVEQHDVARAGGVQYRHLTAELRGCNRHRGLRLRWCDRAGAEQVQLREQVVGAGPDRIERARIDLTFGEKVADLGRDRSRSRPSAVNSDTPGSWLTRAPPSA